jgi:hypothetical protein
MALPELPDDTDVSMNFFCYAPNFIDLCEEQFQEFLGSEMRRAQSRIFTSKYDGLLYKIRARKSAGNSHRVQTGLA